MSNKTEDYLNETFNEILRELVRDLTTLETGILIREHYEKLPILIECKKELDDLSFRVDKDTAERFQKSLEYFTQLLKKLTERCQ